MIFYNVNAVSQVLHGLQEEGYPIDDQAVAMLSPYITQHINRFGKYRLEPGRSPAALDYGVFGLTSGRK